LTIPETSSVRIIMRSIDLTRKTACDATISSLPILIAQMPLM
jgi:hypothetical protein